MSIFSKLLKLLKKIVSKIVNLVKKLFKKFWPLILIGLAVWFAPVIGAWFTANGFGALGSVFTAVGTNVTPHLVSAGKWLATSATSLGGKAVTAFKSLELSTQAGLVVGASALIAPTETAELLEEIVVTTVDTLGGVLSAVTKGLFSSPWLLVAAGVGVFWFVRKKKGDTVYVQSPA